MTKDVSTLLRLVQLCTSDLGSYYVSDMSQTVSESTAKGDSNIDRSPNPYIMAIFTATLAGLFSVIGVCVTANLQSRQAIAQKQFEYRVMAYNSFLDKMDWEKSPALSQILSIGSMSDYLVTDGEIQASENRIANLLKKHSVKNLYWQLDSDLNTLQLHGSRRVAEISNDILKALLFLDEEIKWDSYPSDIAEFYEHWKVAQEKGVGYGWNEQITADERLMVVITSKLIRVLVEQLRLEIYSPST
jgi:hypothetical protein